MCLSRVCETIQGIVIDKLLQVMNLNREWEPMRRKVRIALTKTKFMIHTNNYNYFLIKFHKVLKLLLIKNPDYI